MEPEGKWIIELKSLSAPSRRPSAAAEDRHLYQGFFAFNFIVVSALAVIAFGWSLSFYVKSKFESHDLLCILGLNNVQTLSD